MRARWVPLLVVLVGSMAHAQAGTVVFTKTVGAWTLTAREGLGPQGAAVELVVTAPNASPRQFWFDRRVRDVEDAYLAANSRFVFVHKGSSAWYISVVPLVATEPSDFFRCYWPSVSPSGRLVAYKRFLPRNVPGSPVLLVYDAAASPTSNRMRPPIGAEPSEEEVGWTFFPDTERIARSYGGPVSDTKGLKSPLTWVDDTRVAFVEFSGGSARVVLADFTAGVQFPDVRVQTLDADTLVDSRYIRKGDAPAAWLVVESISATIPSPGVVELTLTFTDTARPALRASSVVVRF